MKPKSPAKRSSHADASEQMDRLYDRLVYWLYERQDNRRARRFADRLEQLLATSPPEAESIFAEECRSLVHEAKGDLAKAIAHRENEIRLLRRLHRLSQDTAGRNFVLRQYSIADLRDRLHLLAMLYHGIGDLDRAIETLQESRRLCEKSGIKFDGKTILREYRAERRSGERGGEGRHC